jgi:phage protein D
MLAPVTPAQYSALPNLVVQGQPAAELCEALLSLSVEEDDSGLRRCEMALGNWGSRQDGAGFLFFNRDALDFGTEIAVEVGTGETEATVFEGRITGIEARYPRDRSPEITFLAEDRLQDLRMTRRSRTHESSSDAELFRQIASEHGLTPRVDLDGPTHRVLAQVNQSDLAFLRDRARAIGAEVWVRGQTLYAQPRASRQQGRVELDHGDRLWEFSVIADLATQRTSYWVSGWDVAGKASITYEADASILGEELREHDGGGALLQRAFGARPEQAAHCVPLTAEEARLQAESRYRGMARRFVTGRGVAEGDGRIGVGVEVVLGGLGLLFDGSYYVSETRHLFDRSAGLRTVFSVERAGLGRP